MPVATGEFRNLLTSLSHNVRRDARTLVSRMGRFTAREGRAFITEAWPELVRPFIDVAAELTAQWYDEQPTTNTVFVPQPADVPPDEQLAVNGRWAMGEDDPAGALGESGERAIFNASRETVLDNVIREDGARWVREARPGACPFCKMLTTRADVYYTERSALTVVGRTPNLTRADRRAIAAGQMTRNEAMARHWGDDARTLRGNRGFGESYHDHCRCLAVMIRPGDTYTPQTYAQGWGQEYIDAVAAAEKQLANKGIQRKPTLNEILNAWERNDREARGLKKRGRPKPKSSSGTPAAGGTPETSPSSPPDEPPTTPPTGGQAVQGGDEPPRYPRVGGDGGEVPFTPDGRPPITEDLLDHVMDGSPKKDGWDGGHGFGTGRGKSEFPESWDRTRVAEAIDEVLRSPDEIERNGSTLYFRGTVGGQPLTVRVKGRMQGRPKVWTAYPGHG